MKKCPECGEELKKDDVLIAIRDDKTDEILGYIHVKLDTLNRFRILCAEHDIRPSTLFNQMMRDYITKSKASADT